jgi:hypothetical protein
LFVLDVSATSLKVAVSLSLHIHLAGNYTGLGDSGIHRLKKRG